MPKPIILVAAIASVIIVAGGIVAITNKKDDTSRSNSSSQTNTKQSDNKVVVNDPLGSYKYFSDPSITKTPEKNAVFGKERVITVEYDGSKSKEGDSLFYALYYVDLKGDVRPVTGRPFDGNTKGTFTASGKVFESNAKNRPGFMEVSIVQNARFVGGEQAVAGDKVTLGMYPIEFDVEE